MVNLILKKTTQNDLIKNNYLKKNVKTLNSH